MTIKTTKKLLKAGMSIEEIVELEASLDNYETGRSSVGKVC